MSGSVSAVGDSFRFGDSYRISELCELVKDAIASRSTNPCQWVGQSVIVSDFGVSYRIYRACVCELLDSLPYAYCIIGQCKASHLREASPYPNGCFYTWKWKWPLTHEHEHEQTILEPNTVLFFMYFQKRHFVAKSMLLQEIKPGAMWSNVKLCKAL